MAGIEKVQFTFFLKFHPKVKLTLLFVGSVYFQIVSLVVEVE